MIEQHIKNSIQVKENIVGDKDLLEKVQQAVDLISDCLQSGGKLLVAGNGGSAADAQHLAAELVGRYQQERKGYAALSLTTDTSVLTSVANDYSYSQVFSRQVEALGKEGDVFVGISTSGNSDNVIEAVKTAQDKGLKTICLLGKGGGKLAGQSTLDLIVPSDDTPHIQEAHTMLIHIICGQVEKKLS